MGGGQACWVRVDPPTRFATPTSNYRTIGNVPKQQKDKNDLKLFSIRQMYSNNLFFFIKKNNKKRFLFSKNKIKFHTLVFLFFIF
jgi:hypothetical protein